MKKTARSIKKIAPDFMMWVGSVHYPTVDDYIDETARRGPCKRLGQLPKDLVLGESRVFLAHDDGIVGAGFVFGYFIPTQVEYLVRKEEDLPDHLYDRVEAIYMNDIRKEEPRMCGVRKEGMYLVSRAAPDKMAEFYVFDKPRQLARFVNDQHHFRGLCHIDFGQDMIDTANKKDLMTPPSRLAAEPIPQGVAWTEEEDKMIFQLMSASPNKAMMAQSICFKTGRSKTSILYRYNHVLSEGNVDEEDAE